MPLLVIVLFLLPGGAFSTSGDGGAFPITSGHGGGGCNHSCVGYIVPYPFGFSSDCPIPLACNAATSTPLLPHSTSTAAAPYPIISFNSTTSTFLVSIEPSCNRSVPEAKASLTGAGYAVSSRTGLFLRGDCRAPGAADCTAPSDDMSRQLPTTPCVGNDTIWACNSSMPPPPNSTEAEMSGQGQFMAWEKVVEGTGCENALTALVYDGDGLTSPSVYQYHGDVPRAEVGVAELGWWLNETCANAAISGGGQPCAKNATCHDVETPTGTWGHRCRCVDGMVGDGFAAGTGCYNGENP